MPPLKPHFPMSVALKREGASEFLSGLVKAHIAGPPPERLESVGLR